MTEVYHTVVRRVSYASIIVMLLLRGWPITEAQHTVQSGECHKPASLPCSCFCSIKKGGGDCFLFCNVTQYGMETGS